MLQLFEESRWYGSTATASLVTKLARIHARLQIGLDMVESQMTDKAAEGVGILGGCILEIAEDLHEHAKAHKVRLQVEIDPGKSEERRMGTE